MVSERMQTIKNIIRAALRHFDKSISHLPAVFDENRHSELRVSVHMLLSELYLNNPDITIIQVGAYDGFANDPLATFVQQHPVRTIMVEPQQQAYSQLVKTTKPFCHIQTLNVAVSERDEQRTLYTLAADDKLPDWAHQLASFNRASILKHSPWIPDVSDRIVPITVECVSPKTLLRRVGVNQVDALIIDAEGYDMKILQTFFAIGQRPSLICFEHRHLERGEFDLGVKRLFEDGYQLSYQHMDVLAVWGREVFEMQSLPKMVEA